MPTRSIDSESVSTAPRSGPRFAVPLGAFQHSLLVTSVVLVAIGVVVHHGGAALPVAIGAIGVAIATHLGLLGGVLLAAVGALGWVTRSARAADVERLLDAADLRGSEVVLDVGCGDGLVAIRAAHRLASGRVIAVDDWHRPHGTRALSAEAAQRNAVASGVSDRVEVRTASFSRLGVDDASVDVAIASFSLHHLPRAERDAAVHAMVRAVRPGGRLLFAEPRYRDELAAALASSGARSIERRARTFPRALFGWILARR